MRELMRVLETALPVFAAIALGMLCRRRRLFNDGGMAALRRAAVDICLPAVMFAALASADYTPRLLAVPVLTYAACVLMLALGFLGRRLTRAKSALSPYLMTGFEAGMLGYGLFALLFKGVSRSAFAILDLGQCLFVFTLYKFLLCRRSASGSALRDAITSPVLWAMVLGFLTGVTGLWKALEDCGVQGVLTAVTDFISAPTSMLVLLSIGYDLVPGEIRWRSVAVYVLQRIVICGAVLGLLTLADRYLLGSIMHTGALVLMFILPPPFVLPMFVDAGEERADISSTLSVLTLFTVLMFAVLAAVL